MSVIVQPYRFQVSGGGGGSVPTHSLSLNGSSQYLSMSDANFGAYDRAKFAIAGAINLDVVSGDRTIIAQRNASGEVAFTIQTTNAGALETLFSENGVSPSQSLNRTSGSLITSGNWFAFLIHYDSANSTSGDRIKLWVNGSLQTPAGYIAPTAAVYNSSSDISVGARLASPASLYLDGLIYSLGFFSAALPAPTDVFDGTAGKVKSFTGLAGLHSLLDVAAGSVVADAVRASDWTNNGTVTASSSVP